MNNVYLSILIPTYNNLKGLNKIIECIQYSKQNSEFYEIIISDDSFLPLLNEDKINSLNKIFKNFKYFHNKNRLGPGKNWNKLITLSKGNYYWLLHHDEYWDKNYDLLSFFINSFKKDISLYILPIKKIKYIRMFNFKLKISQIHTAPNWIKKYFFKNPRRLINVNIVGPPSSLIISKKYIHKYDSNLKFLIDIDYYISLLRIIDINSIVNFNKINYQILSSQNNKNSITKSLSNKKNKLKYIEKNFLTNKYHHKLSIIEKINDFYYFLSYKVFSLISLRIKFSSVYFK